MALTSFCGLVTLQVGATVLGAVFFTLASVIMAANIFEFSYSNAYYGETANGGDNKKKDEGVGEEENETLPTAIIIVILFVIGLLIAGFLTFFSSYNETRSFALFAVTVIVVLFIFWVVLCILSFMSHPDHLDYICVDKRCPESFWIANLKYRNPDWKPDDGDSTKKGKPTNRPRTKRGANYTYSKEFDEKVPLLNEVLFSSTQYPEPMSYVHHISIQDKYYNDTRSNTNIKPTKTATTIQTYYFLKKDSTEEEKLSRYTIGRPFFGAIILFVVNFIFLIFSALLLWSWSRELDWVEYYDEGPVYYEYY